MSFRLAGFYAAYFAVVGVSVPYWPVWLKAQGMGPGEIGVLMGAVLWLKPLLNPLIAQAADRRRARRDVMVALSLLALAGYLGYAMAAGFWWFLALGLITGIASSAALPLGESLTLARVYADGLDYGRIRLWGSISFILASVAVGHLLERWHADVILGALALLTVAAVAASARMPGTAAGGEPAPAGAIWRLLTQPVFLVFVLAVSLNQASHAVFYGFATLHWRAAGIGDGVIGLLWAEGVVAEIALFGLSNRALGRLGVTGLLVLASGAAALRWLGFALSAALPVLIVGQALHGLSFGAAHLGAMHFIARAIPPEMTATAQSLRAALAGGLASGGGLLLAGWLYGLVAGQAFIAMVGLALAALAAALLLGRLWTGGRL